MRSTWPPACSASGNAILVRRDGELIDDTREIADETPQSDGILSPFNQSEEGRSINGARIELSDE